MIATPEVLRKQVVVKGGCWIFNGPKDRAGYGRIFMADGTERKAQRVYYEAFIGPIPERGRLRHHLAPGKCIGAGCCNPAHLEMRVPFTSVSIPTSRKVCKDGHLISGENVVIEQRGANFLLRCRTCRQEAWRKQKRKA